MHEYPKQGKGIVNDGSVSEQHVVTSTDLVVLLIQQGQREMAILDELAFAVEQGNRETVFSIAGKLIEEIRAHTNQVPNASLKKGLMCLNETTSKE